jgi:hypothetical protein
LILRAPREQLHFKFVALSCSGHRESVRSVVFLSFFSAALTSGCICFILISLSPVLLAVHPLPSPTAAYLSPPLPLSTPLYLRALRWCCPPSPRQSKTLILILGLSSPPSRRPKILILILGASSPPLALGLARWRHPHRSQLQHRLLLRRPLPRIRVPDHGKSERGPGHVVALPRDRSHKTLSDFKFPLYSQA